MQPSTISWSNLVKIKSGSTNYNIWPTISTPIQKNILNKKFSLVNATVVQTLQTVPSKSNCSHQPVSPINALVDEIAKFGFEENKKSRDEIVAERKQRKLAAKQLRQKESLDQKLIEVRLPKSQKIQIIDNTFLENYKKCNDNSNSIKQHEDNLDGSISVPKVTTRNRIKQRLKNKNTISVSLMELIKTKKLQKCNEQASKLEKNKSVILSNPTIKRHRGKQREFQKAKPLKRFKRNIVSIRLLRRELREEAIPSDNVMKLELNSSSIKYSRKFRSYCDHYATTEINTAVESLLQDLFRFQKRAYEKNQIKGCSKRRYVVGFNEVRRHLELKKVKLLIIAPDLEPNEGLGGLDETVHNFKSISQTNDIPYVFAASRWRIGRFLFKKVPVSCVAILNYDGASEQYKRILELVAVERDTFLKDSEGTKTHVQFRETVGIPQTKISILNVSNFNSDRLINSSTNRLVKIEFFSSRDVQPCLEKLDEDVSIYGIAEFLGSPVILRRLKLNTTYKFPNSRINLKNNGGLITPSPSVLKICK